MYLSNGTNHSQNFKSNKALNILTIVLFGIGVLAGVGFVYQQFGPAAEPFTISKDEAIRLALIQVDKEPRRYAELLPHEEGTAKLIHVTDHGISFVSDENSLDDMWLYTLEGTPLDAYENKYFWDVTVTTTNASDERAYHYWVDADSGKVIGQDFSDNN